MQFISTQKYLRISPKKVRDVARLAKKLSPVEAVEKLPFINKKASVYIIKVIKTALAMAKEKSISDTDLLIKEIQVSEGPRLKRGQPVSRGSWHPIIKRMCHIRVVLETKEPEKKEEEKVKQVSDNKEEGK